MIRLSIGSNKPTSQAYYPIRNLVSAKPIICTLVKSHLEADMQIWACVWVFKKTNYVGHGVAWTFDAQSSKIWCLNLPVHSGRREKDLVHASLNDDSQNP